MTSTASPRNKVFGRTSAGWTRRLAQMLLGVAAATAATAALATVAIGIPQSRDQVAVYIGSGVNDGLGNTARCTTLNVPVKDVGGDGHPDTWVTIELPAGSNLTLGANPGPPFHLGEVPVNAGIGAVPPVIAYFYLCAKDGITTASDGNQVTIKAWDADPSAVPAAGLLDTRVLSGTALTNPASPGLDIRLGNQNANSNKIDSIAFSPLTSTYLGGTFTMTVTGTSGTVGAAERVVFSPSVFKTFRSDLFELRKTELTITGGGTLPPACRDESGSLTVTRNYLACDFSGSGVQWNGTQGDFTMVYTFVVIGPASGTFPITPLNYVDSGANLKYARTKTGSMPSIQTLLSATKTANATSFQLPGGPFSTQYKLVVSSTASGPTEFSDWIDTLPSGVSYVAGSSSLSSSDGQMCGISPAFQPLGDPTVSGSTLRWSRMFVVPAGGTCTLTFNATIPSVAGTYNNCALIQQFSTSIDAGCAAVLVSPPPVAGTLTIIKKTTGGDGAFDFSLNPTGATAQVHTAGGIGQQQISQLAPGQYTLTESSQTGWDFASASCTDGSTGVAGVITFTLASAGSVTCTFNNVARASITVIKQTLPQPDSTNFGFTTTGLPSPTSFSLADGGLQQYANLLPGQTYTVTETAASGYRLEKVQCTVSDGSTAVTYQAGGFSVTPQPGSATVCTYTNLKNASVVIHKALELPAGVTLAAGQNSFDFSLACTGVATAYTTTVTLQTGTSGALSGTATIPGVEAGRDCTLTETSKPTPPTNWAWHTEVIDVATQTTQPGAQTDFHVTNSVDNVPGTLRITKMISPAIAVTAEFDIQYNCLANGSGTVQISLTNATSNFADVTVPGGSICTLSEVGLPSPPATYSYGVPQYAQPGPVIGGALSPTTGTVTNTLASIPPRTLVIDKDIEVQNPAGVNNGVGAGAPNLTGLLFPVQVVCSDSSFTSGTYQLAPATPVQILVQPNGALDPTCTVTEQSVPTAPQNYEWVVSPPPSIQVTVGATGNPNAMVVNTLRRKTATLTVTKLLSGQPSGGAPGTYDFSIDCGNDGTFATSVVLAASATSGSISLAVPAGATCTVSETGRASAPSGYHWGMTPTTPPAPVPSSGATFSFTNTLTADPGTIVVTKVLNAPGDAPVTGQAFAFTLSCSPAATYPTQTITWPNNSTTFENVPAGASCTVVESTLALLPPSGYAYGAPAYSPTSGTPMPPGGSQSFTVTNTLTGLPGTISIQKVLNAPAGLATAGMQFTFTLNCSAGQFAPQTITWPTTTAVFTNVPAGATCTVSEAKPSPPAGFGNSIQYSGMPTVPMRAGGTDLITVINTLQVTPASTQALTSVPTLGRFALLLLGFALAGIAALRFRQRR